MNNTKIPDQISEQVLELRYKPNPKILDYRGTWAEMISTYMGLIHWQIKENRIDIFDVEEKNRAFIGFKNSGLIIRNSPTANYFPDQARKLFKYVFEELEGFGKKLFVERVGVRSRVLSPFAGDLNNLVDLYSSHYLGLTPTASKMLDAELLDIGGPLNFKDQYGNFNTMSGPMPKNQATSFFKFEDESNLPDVGLYIDIDYWKRPNIIMEGKDILDIIRSFAQQTSSRNQQIRDLILEG